MNKINKILVILLIFFLIVTCVYKINASGINMNLSNNRDQTTYGTNNTIDNNTTNTTNNNLTSNSNVSNTSRQPSTIVSNANQNSSDGLTVSDMISIILCSIGVILILLGVAILIRQKN